MMGSWPVPPQEAVGSIIGVHSMEIILPRPKKNSALTYVQGRINNVNGVKPHPVGV